MNKYSKSSYLPNEILEELTVTLQDIDEKYKKVQKLKSLLFSQDQRTHSPISSNSYAARYREQSQKAIRNIKPIPDSYQKKPKRTISKLELNDHFSPTNEVLETEESETIIQDKEKELRAKADKCKASEKRLRQLELQLSVETKELELIEKKHIGHINKLNKEITEEICRGQVHDIIIKTMDAIINKKDTQIQSQKVPIKEKLISAYKLITDLETTKNNLIQESIELDKSYTQLQRKEQELDEILKKFSMDTRTLQNSKHEFTYKQKEDIIKAKETGCLERIKALSQKKNELDIREQKLEIKERAVETAKNAKTKDEVPIRERNLMIREAKNKEIEDELVLQEQDTEAKRKELVDKWEKMISKTDDLNRNDVKNTITSSEIDEKYKEFAAYKKDLESKLTSQETSLANQEVLLIKKIRKLESLAEELTRREKSLKKNEDEVQKFMNSQDRKDEYETYESLDEGFAAAFIERQNKRKEELEEITRETQEISSTLSGFLSELN
ncbi:hypothetical protein SteCoe_17687 [Stentor coeruleus]|uniref:Uncharacterized protein n=1 Tax=Stentor coeruleus TaxID=5963 RepID=A0A1R2BYB2_9CILI|nr:hypothetical protein SteCoe_17687 [Stentor coeruleus]